MEIREVWRGFPALQGRNVLKLDKRRTILQQAQYIVIFDFYKDHSILKPGIATQHNIFDLVLAAIPKHLKASLGAATPTYYQKFLRLPPIRFCSYFITKL